MIAIARIASNHVRHRRPGRPSLNFELVPYRVSPIVTSVPCRVILNDTSFLLLSFERLVEVHHRAHVPPVDLADDVVGPEPATAAGDWSSGVLPAAT